MNSSEARKQLLYALRRVLRPIVRLLIRAGIRFDEFAELARGVYVESAIRDGIAYAGAPTRERISLATGVTRQQVDYYIENEGVLPSADPTLARVVTEVLHKWHTEPQYLGPYGVPLELEFELPPGRSFRSLVALADPKASPGLVLEELLRAGSVVHSGEGHFRAVSRAFMVSEAMSPEQTEYFGDALTRLARTLDHNFNPINLEKRLERFVAADRGLPIELIPRFEKFARDRANQFLVDLDNWLAPYAGPELADFGPRVGTGVNVFLYVDMPSDPRSLTELVRAPRKL